MRELDRIMAASCSVWTFSYALPEDIDIDNFDILYWFLLVRLDILDSVYHINPLDGTPENGVLTVQPWLVER